VDDCLGGSFDTRHGPGRLPQQSSAISLARSDVEYVETAAKSTCEKVAMEVFDLNLPGESSCQTLPRPLEGRLRYWPLKDLAHVSDLNRWLTKARSGLCPIQWIVPERSRDRKTQELVCLGASNVGSRAYARAPRVWIPHPIGRMISGTWKTRTGE
jgi:hypothetical protein